MALPERIPQVAPSAIATFDFVDIAEGTGTVVYFGTVSGTSSGQSLLLVSNQDDSTVAFLAAGTHNFDTLKFNLPRTLKGTAYIAGYFSSSLTNDTVTVKIQIWDGSTATDVSSAIVSQIANQTKKILYMKIPLTTTHIKAGEQVRAEIVTSGNTVIGTSPTGQSDATLTDGTTLKLGISFRTQE